MSNSLHTLIGKHPNDSFFSIWLTYEDPSEPESKKHRKLVEIEGKRNEIISKISECIIKHHINEKRLNKIKNKINILDKSGFTKLAELKRRFPQSENVKKGNAAEILLAEYLRCSSGYDLLVYRLRYNPNVDQSMKGDDVLLFDIQNKNDVGIILGESKYRNKATKQVVQEIVSSLDKDKLPLSLTFVSECLESENEEIADLIDNICLQQIKDKNRLIYAGFLLSDVSCYAVVDQHLKSENSNLVFLSLGISNSDEFIDQLFQHSEEILAKYIQE